MKTIVIQVLLVLMLAGIVQAVDNPEDWGCCCGAATGFFEQRGICEDVGGNFTLVPGYIDDVGGYEPNFCNQICDFGGDEPPTQTTYVRLNGTVINSSNDEGIADATIYISVQNSQGFSTTDADGTFEFGRLPRQEEITLVVMHPFCTSEIFTETLTSNLYNQEYYLNCSVNSCAHTPIDVLGIQEGDFKVLVTPEQPEITPQCKDELSQVFLTICYDDECKNLPYSPNNNLPGYPVSELFSQKPAMLDLIANGFTKEGYDENKLVNGWIDTQKHLDQGVQEPLMIYFNVSYRGDWVVGEPYEFYIGDYTCWEKGDSFCIPDVYHNQNYVDVKASCNEQNELIEPFPEDDYCTSQQYCTQDYGSDPECRAKERCDYCNLISSMMPGLFNLLPGLSCAETLQGNTYASCFWDNSKLTAQDEMKSCEYVQDCYDYTTKISCEGSPCGSSSQGGCEWLGSAPEELGRGICKPAEAFSCKECTDKLGELCDQTMCEGFEGCAYVERGTEGICINANTDLYCEHYTTEFACTNGRAVDVDVTYDADGVGIAGTNTFLQYSNDTFNLGVCKWGDVDGDMQCFKDSNDDDERDDCGIERGFYYVPCLKDRTPPRTTLPITTNTEIGFNELIEMDVTTIDNVFSEFDIKTYFCLTDINSNCYPNQQLDDLDSPTDTGQFILKYFSEDASNNLEPVRQINVFLNNVSKPDILTVDIEP